MTNLGGASAGGSCGSHGPAVMRKKKWKSFPAKSGWEVVCWPPTVCPRQGQGSPSLWPHAGVTWGLALARGTCGNMKRILSRRCLCEEDIFHLCGWRNTDLDIWTCSLNPTVFHVGWMLNWLGFFCRICWRLKNNLSLVERNILLSGICNLSRGLDS